jgi:ATPases involved in chromosome partitioning
MAFTAAISNNKGGTKKTTDTIQLGYIFAQRGYKTLLVSMDPQCNIDYSLLGYIEDEEELDDETMQRLQGEFDEFDGEYQLDEEEQENSDDEDDEVTSLPGEGVPTLYDVIIGINGDQKKKRHIREVIVPVPQQENLYLAKGSIALSDMDINLSATNGREKILKRALETIQDEFDIILIDTPPTLGLAPVNAFVAAGSHKNVPGSRTNGVIIAISPQVYSVLGIRTLIGAFIQLRSALEIPLPIFGVICADVKRTKNAKKRMKQVRSFFGKAVFQTTIPQNEKVEEAADAQLPLGKYAPSSPGAKAYAALADEFLTRAGLALRKGE